MNKYYNHHIIKKGEGNMKKISMKRITAASLAVLMGLSLAACGSNTESSTTTTDSSTSGAETTTDATTETTEATEATTSGEKTKVVVWSKNSHDLEYMTEKVKEYNLTNTDNIEIEYVVQSSSDYLNLITMSASSGQSPDVFSNTTVNLSEFATAGIIQPLNDMMTDEFKKVNEVDTHIYEGINALEDDIYWVAGGMRSGSRLIYNVELFEKAGVEVPTTLAETVEAAKTLTVAGDGVSYGTIFPGLSSPFERWIEHSAELSGVTPYDYANGKYDFTGFKPIIEAIKQMFVDGSVLPGSASMEIDPTRTQFAAGNVGFYGNASQEAGVLTDQFPAENEWAVAQLPTLDGEIKGALTCTPNAGWFMSGSTKNKEAAWKVIEYFQSEDFLKGYIEGGYTLPISSYMDSLVDKTKMGRLAQFALEDYETVYPQAPTVTPAGETYRDALWNACLSDGPDIDETIATLNKTYNEALDKDVASGKVKRLIIENYDPLHPNDGTITYLDK